MDTAFDLREEILAMYMPICPIGCNGTSAELGIDGDKMLLTCPDCHESREHRLSTVPDIVFRILYVDFVDPVEGIQ